MLIKYIERDFEVCVDDRYEPAFRSMNVPVQLFKVHFSCGEQLTPKQKEFLIGLQHQVLTAEPGCKKLVAPGFKTFIPYAAVNGQMSLRERRLVGYARGTLYLSHYNETRPRLLAEMLVEMSQHFAPEDLSTMDYSAGYLPYCPGLFIRKSCCSAPGLRRYRYIPADQVERSAKMIRAQADNYDQFNQAVDLRSELRVDAQYIRIQECLHEYFISNLEAVMLITDRKPLFQTVHTAANQLKNMMMLYKEKGYEGSKEIFKRLNLVVMRFPCVKKGILKITYNHFQAEIQRAIRFYDFRISHKHKINALRKHEERLIKRKQALTPKQQDHAALSRSLSM